MQSPLTPAELSCRTDAELRILFRMISEQMQSYSYGSQERRNAAASLETIASVLNRRYTLRP